MKRILLAGALDTTSQTFVRQLSQNNHVSLTVYTPSAVDLPQSVMALTGETLDEGGLTAAMLDQDMVVALVPTIKLTQTVTTLITAAQAAGTRRLLVGRTDDIVELPGQIRDARRQLMTAGLDFDLVDGFGEINTLLAVNPAPVKVFGSDDADVPLTKFAG